jgi:hypothetical protein
VILCINVPQVFSKDGLLCDTWAGHTLKLELREELQPVLDADDIPEELTAVPEAKVWNSSHTFRMFHCSLVASDAGFLFAHQKVLCIEITFRFWSGNAHAPIQPA